MDSEDDIDEERSFVISYFLASDTISIYESKSAYTSRGQRFLEASRIRHHDATSDNVFYYSEGDLYPGARLVVSRARGPASDDESPPSPFPDSCPSVFPLPYLRCTRAPLFSASATATWPSTPRHTRKSTRPRRATPFFGNTTWQTKGRSDLGEARRARRAAERGAPHTDTVFSNRTAPTHSRRASSSIHVSGKARPLQTLQKPRPTTTNSPSRTTTRRRMRSAILSCPRWPRRSSTSMTSCTRSCWRTTPTARACSPPTWLWTPLSR